MKTLEIISTAIIILVFFTKIIKIAIAPFKKRNIVYFYGFFASFYLISYMLSKVMALRNISNLLSISILLLSRNKNIKIVKNTTYSIIKLLMHLIIVYIKYKPLFQQLIFIFVVKVLVKIIDMLLHTRFEAFLLYKMVKYRVMPWISCKTSLIRTFTSLK